MAEPTSSLSSLPSLSVSERKKLLVAQGALHRANMLVARADIAIASEPAVMARTILTRMGAAAKASALDNLRIGGVRVGDVNLKGGLDLRTLSPLLLGVWSLLTKAAVRKPLIYVAVAGGAIAGATYLLNKLGKPENTAVIDDPFNHIN